MKYNKLVRDKIPEYIRSRGGVPVTHVANGAEYWEKLKEKLLEEIGEFQKDEIVEEFADILEVIDAVAEFKGFNAEEVKRVKEEKAEKRGRFNDKIILDES